MVSICIPFNFYLCTLLIFICLSIVFHFLTIGFYLPNHRFLFEKPLVITLQTVSYRQYCQWIPLFLQAHSSLSVDNILLFVDNFQWILWIIFVLLWINCGYFGWSLPVSPHSVLVFSIIFFYTFIFSKKPPIRSRLLLPAPQSWKQKNISHCHRSPSPT